MSLSKASITIGADISKVKRGLSGLSSSFKAIGSKLTDSIAKPMKAAAANVGSVFKTALGTAGGLFIASFVGKLGSGLFKVLDPRRLVGTRAFAPLAKSFRVLEVAWARMKGTIDYCVATIWKGFNFKVAAKGLDAINDKIKTYFPKILAAVKVFLGFIVSNGIPIIQTIFSYILTVITTVIQYVQTIFNFVMGGWSNISAMLIVGVSTAFDYIFAGIEALSNMLFTSLAAIFDYLFPHSEGYFNGIFDYLSQLWNNIYSGFESAYNYIYKTIEGLFSWILERIMNPFETLQKVAQAYFDMWHNFFMFLFENWDKLPGIIYNGIVSALVKLYDYFESWWNWLMAKGKAAVKAVQDTAGSVVSGVTEAPKRIQENIASGLNSVAEWKNNKVEGAKAQLASNTAVVKQPGIAGITAMLPTPIQNLFEKIGTAFESAGKLDVGKTGFNEKLSLGGNAAVGTSMSNVMSGLMGQNTDQKMLLELQSLNAMFKGGKAKTKSELTAN